MWMLLPRRTNNGCSSTLTMMYRSPDGAPRRPAWAKPRYFILPPFDIPAGILTVTVVSSASEPAPPHFKHFSLAIEPSPPQAGQVRLKLNPPWFCAMTPRPPQVAQFTTGEPGLAPTPPQAL